MCGRCIQLGHHPQAFKSAGAVVISKPEKRDQTSPQSWLLISLLSYIGKGFKRLLADSSQTQFLQFQHTARTYGHVSTHWCPGNIAVSRNEFADTMAKAGGRPPPPPPFILSTIPHAYAGNSEQRQLRNLHG
jgi:hypothetical protein